MNDHEIQFSEMDAEGNVSSIRMIRQADIMKCPFYILVPDHYREDGTCKCDDPEHRAMMIREWGYKKKQFKDIPMRGSSE